MKIRTIIGATLIISFSVYLLWGCGESGTSQPEVKPLPVAGEFGREPINPEPVDEGTPVDGDWLIMRLPSEPPHLNPITSSDGYSRKINDVVFDTLIYRSHVDFEYEPRLATSWEVSPDHLTYTFHMRKDATFSDGLPVTAHDVKFSFDKIKDPGVDAAHLRNYYNSVESCEIIDDYIVKFTCNKPYFQHLGVVGEFYIIPRHIYGEGDFNKHPNNRHPIGSGPYVFERWDTGSQIVLARNENYYGEKPHLMKMVYKVVTDDNAALQLLERQELDVMAVTPETWVRRAKDPDFQAKFNLRSYYLPRYGFIMWNEARPQFQDKRVRKALTLLLDRPLILETIFHGFGRLAIGTFYDESENNMALKPLPFDPEQAKQLLTEAGWVDRDNDGVREKEGIPFRFEMMMPTGSREYDQMLTVYQEELRRAGIEMSLRPLEWATYSERLDFRNFDAAPLLWSNPSVVDSDPYQIWHSSQTEHKGSNFIGFKNEEVDRILEKARTEFDRGKRIKMYHRFQEILYEEQPYTLTFNYQSLVAIDKRFRNVRIYKRGPMPEEWWVPAELQKYK